MSTGSSNGFRKSRHAEQRKAEGRRISQAYNDVQRARQSDLFIQPEDERYVVRAVKGREHIFEPDGELVTTPHHRSKKAHRNLVLKGMRRAVTEEEYKRFKELFP